jgi:hypothetical protein
MPRHSRQNLADLERELLPAPTTNPATCQHERRELYQCGCYDGCNTCNYNSRCIGCNKLLGDKPNARRSR